jgi:hypothetical protein
MTDRRKITEGRLREALQRLLEGQPKNTKPSGSITLNKINREAKLGNSYIHKFPEFVAEANPAIEKYNNEKRKVLAGGIDLAQVELSAQERSKLEQKREILLRERYRRERNDARKAKAELESLNNSLMFRVYDLQEQLRHSRVTPISEGKKPN